MHTTNSSFLIAASSFSTLACPRKWKVNKRFSLKVKASFQIRISVSSGSSLPFCSHDPIWCPARPSWMPLCVLSPPPLRTAIPATKAWDRSPMCVLQLSNRLIRSQTFLTNQERAQARDTTRDSNWRNLREKKDARIFVYRAIYVLHFFIRWHQRNWLHSSYVEKAISIFVGWRFPYFKNVFFSMNEMV